MGSTGDHRGQSGQQGTTPACHQSTATVPAGEGPSSSRSGSASAGTNVQDVNTTGFDPSEPEPRPELRPFFFSSGPTRMLVRYLSDLPMPSPSATEAVHQSFDKNAPSSQLKSRYRRSASMGGGRLPDRTSSLLGPLSSSQVDNFRLQSRSISFSASKNIRNPMIQISSVPRQGHPLAETPGGQLSTPGFLNSQRTSNASEFLSPRPSPSPRKPSALRSRQASSYNILSTNSRRMSEALYKSDASSISTAWSFQSAIHQESPKAPYDSEAELTSVSRKLLRMQKYLLIAWYLGLNAVFIWALFAHYQKTWWVLLPFLSLGTVAQAIFACLIIFTAASTAVYHLFRPFKHEAPKVLEKIVMMVPCYNENRQEMYSCVDSLVEQIHVGNHLRIIMVVVDGNARAPGEDRTTQDVLLNEMFAGGERTVFENGYLARNGFPMEVTVQEGMYKGVPYIVIAKASNQGKRDSLCFVRSFLWHYRNRSENIPTMFNQDLFDYLGSILTDNGLDTVDYLAGMDGDTTFAPDCMYELIRSVRTCGPDIVGVCGAVLVKFDQPPIGMLNKASYYFWTILQSTEYMTTQGLRREFQSRVTGKVNCLPGCCQLIRVCEAAFGDEVLRMNYNYVPKPNDIMVKQIMGVYSEDSLHASLIFSLFPKCRTAQSLRARAFTTVPGSWKVFLSQRKRWALGSVCNEMLMAFRPGIVLIERLACLISIITFWIGPFLYAAVIALIILVAKRGTELVHNNLLMGLLSVLLFRYVYTFAMVLWFPHDLASRLRFVVGFFLNLVVGPFVNVIITTYSLLHCDEFSWGKTRVSASEDQSYLHPGLDMRGEKDEADEGSTDPERDAGMGREATAEERTAYEIMRFSEKGPY